MIKKDSFWVLPILAGIVCLGPLSTDMYLPAQPAMKADLNASVEQIQLTLSIFMIGIAVGQPIWGPLSDRFGRRSVIVAGVSIFLVASLACALSNSIEMLIFARFFQAFGACVGGTIGRTIVRDLYGHEDAARAFAYLASIMALAPAVAPIFGGFIVSVYDWQAVFVCLFIIGFVNVGIYLWNFDETLAHEYRQSIRLKPILKNYGLLFRDRAFMAYVAIISCIFAGLFSFISGASFIFIEFLGVTERQFGFCFLGMVIGFIAGASSGGKLSGKIPHQRIIITGISIACISGIACWALAVNEIYHVASIVIPISFYAMGVGLVMPQCGAAALQDYPHIAGTASSLMGTTQNIVAAAVGIGVANFHDGTPLTMASFLCLSALFGLASFALILPKKTTTPA